MPRAAKGIESVFHGNIHRLFASAASIGAATVAVIPNTAASTPLVTCGDPDALAAKLAEKYDERAVAFGIGLDGSLLQIFAAPDGETYTVVVQRPDGDACAVAAGENWTDIPPAIADGPDA